MALSGAGFDGTLLEADWARLAGPDGLPDPSISGQSTGDLLVTVSTSALRATVAAGTYVRHGILCRSTAVETVTFTNPGSGSRWDAVCLLINWATNSVSLVVVQGTATKAIPWASMQTTIGTQVHVPIALVQLTAGSAAPSDSHDLRLGRGWRDASFYAPNGFSQWTGADRAQWSYSADGTAVDLRGSCQMTAGAKWDVGMLVGLPAPSATQLVGWVQMLQGGRAPIIIEAGNTELHMDAAGSSGTVGDAGIIRIESGARYYL